MIRFGVRRIGIGAMVGGMALVVAACGNSSNGTTTGSASGGASSSAKTETVNVGVLPIADVAPLYLGIKQGFFAQQHLTVEPHVLQGGAAVASAVVGGSLQFGFGATANLVLGRAHGLPLQFVAAGDQASPTASTDWTGILVSAQSGITSVSQLAGKTVAANAIKGENELALDAILQQNGVSPSSVHVVALGFPTMPSALVSGQVAAVTEVEPFVSAVEAKGGKLISPLFEAQEPSETIAGYFTSNSEIQNNPGLVARFVAALNQSLDFAEANPGAVRSVIPTYTAIPASAAAKMTLPTFAPAINVPSLQNQENLMEKLGWLSSQPSLNSFIWSGAKR